MNKVTYSTIVEDAIYAKQLEKLARALKSWIRREGDQGDSVDRVYTN